MPVMSSPSVNELASGSMRIDLANSIFATLRRAPVHCTFITSPEDADVMCMARAWVLRCGAAEARGHHHLEKNTLSRVTGTKREPFSGCRAPTGDRREEPLSRWMEETQVRPSMSSGMAEEQYKREIVRVHSLYKQATEGDVASPRPNIFTPVRTKHCPHI